MEEYADQVRRKRSTGNRYPSSKKCADHYCVMFNLQLKKEGYPLIHVAFFDYNEINHEIFFIFQKYGHAGQGDQKWQKHVYRYTNTENYIQVHQAVDFWV